MAALAERAPRAAAPPRRRRPKERPRGRPRSALLDWIAYAALRAVAGVLAVVPLRVAIVLGEIGATVVYLVHRPLRRIGMQNLAIAFPEKPLGERRRILWGSYLNLGRSAAELAHLPRLSDERLREMVRFEDEAWWREAITWERATGVLVLSGHFGNWELLVYAHGRRGHPVHMVHRAIANPYVDRWVNALRARAGTRMIRKSTAGKAVLRALHDRGLLVLPIDQNSTRGLGVFVDFFGVPASTNAGMARIALRVDTPVVPAFIVREGRSARHRVHVLPILEVERTGDFEDDVRRNTQRFTAVFEEMVRRHPEHWLWMHKRWKTRPLGAPRIY
ncbi:MAG TPA: lysophospholipid acyltransferase family protein [Candidatus Binatia bacterium]|jgi:KDO2-lipid IV(A) lauroyltransferase|nr:lysophospholipid acyltransferase family protein [Candidatus Binatia bacterium]